MFTTLSQLVPFVHAVSEVQSQGTSVQADIFNVNTYDMLFFYYFTSSTKGL